MRPIDEYLQDADRLVQDVVDAWGANVIAGDRKLLTADFTALLEKALVYREIKRTADDRREHGIMLDHLAVAEKEARQAFAETYKAFAEKQAATAS